MGELYVTLLPWGMLLCCEVMVGEVVTSVMVGEVVILVMVAEVVTSVMVRKPVTSVVVRGDSLIGEVVTS